MAGPGPHPWPPVDLHARSPAFVEAAGPWIRGYNVARPARYFDRGTTSRFNAPSEEFGTLYMTDDTHGAFIESFGRQLNVRSVTANALTLRGIAQVDSVRPLRFIDLAGGLARLGADNRLMGGDYDVTQAWAKALWEHPEQADGLHYALRHDPTRRGYAVFDRAEDALHARPLGTFWDPRRRDELAGILDTYGFGLIVE